MRKAQSKIRKMWHDARFNTHLEWLFWLEHQAIGKEASREDYRKVGASIEKYFREYRH